MLITGVCGGVGRATAAIFRDEGWLVAGADRQERPDGGVVDAFLQVDVSQTGFAEQISRFIDDLGGIDALVNNAASQIEKHLTETALADWDLVMATNLRGPFVASRALADRLSARNGAIVNVSSVHAVATSVGIGAYAVSKAGLVALTRSAALELAPDVRVNAVLPGAVDTPMLRAGLRRWSSDAADLGAAMQRLKERTPLGRIGEPREIAHAILFLADARHSSFITGQTIVVDGGVLARLSSES